MLCLPTPTALNAKHRESKIPKPSGPRFPKELREQRSPTPTALKPVRPSSPYSSELLNVAPRRLWR